MDVNLPVVIRVAEKSEVVELSALAIRTYTEAFGRTFSAADLKAHLNRHLLPEHFLRMLERDVVLVAAVGERLIAYVQFGAAEKSVGEERDQELRRLYVDSTFQNKGYGTMLMDAALNHPQMRNGDIFLDVWEHNQGAQRFYERHGFVVIGSQSFEVESGAETSRDLIMVRRRASVRK